MNTRVLKWLYLVFLSLVWGSSFILIKYALIGLTPIQVGALRILITAFFLLIVGFKSLKKIGIKEWKYISITAFLGTFFPAFLFSFAITKVDSSFAAILNSFTPFNTLIFGALLFGFSFQKKQIIGIIIGLIGTILLIYNSDSIDFKTDYFYVSFILVASIGYAFNVNIIKKYLQNVNALAITTGNFIILIIPTIIVLYYSGFFENFTLTSKTKSSIGYIVILAIFGTAIAKTIFNKLVQISSPIFSASVTYLIPIVAVTLGVLDGEVLGFMQLFSALIILFGVYLVNRN
jgi:drug/metabolite transporter (DMT)-like permease